MKNPCLALTLVLLASAPAAAHADGLPLPVDESNNGVLNDEGLIRHVTAYARGSTAVVSQDARDGSVIAADIFKGRFTVPLVSYDGTAGGLSADERTLVLIRPRAGFPRKRTTFALLRSDRPRLRLRLRRVIALRGDFSFDALSPDGRSLFLINYISRRDPARYRVRVFDLGRGRLARKAITDPREEPDEMNGFPISRVTSPSGRWAYTLYDGTEGHPFIHALDTVKRRAVCIDLDDVHGDPFRLRLESDEAGSELMVTRGKRVLAMVDTKSFEVRYPDGDAAAAQDTSSGGIPWPLPAAVLALLGGALLARSRARAR